MNILYSCDENYSPYTGISITSLFENNKEVDEINVYILGFAISENNKQNLYHLAQRYKRNIIFIDVEKIDKYLKERNVRLIHEKSRATYYRLFLEKVIPEHISKILYIDSDTVIVGSLAKLTTFCFEDNKTCAMICERVFRGYNDLIGITEKDMYYNAGVLYIDLARWREFKCSEKIMEAIERGYVNFFLHDQDLLSRTINENIQVLPPEYNVLSDWVDIGLNNLYSYKDVDESTFHSLDEIEYALQNPVILHCKKMQSFTEAPWVYDNRNPFENEWIKYKNLSLWHNIPMIVKKSTYKDKVRRFLLLTLPRSLYLKITKYETKRHITRYYQKIAER